MSIALIIIIAVVVLLLLFIIVMYNKLVKSRNKVKTQWAQIEVQLKRRADLIPNLVETVKGYAKHESATLEEVTEARTQYMNANGMDEQIKASGDLTQALGKLFALSENYPDLKANTNFMQMQTDLTDTENKIAYARQFYNDTTLSYNNIVEMFPSNIIAGMFRFKQYPFFEAEEEAKVAPKVSF